MIYVHRTALVNYKESQLVDIKDKCKQVAAKFVRRTDHFIQLAILGVAQIKHDTPIDSDCALYLTSGHGNIGVFQRLCDQRFVDKTPPKPVDFINSLSNTAGFYIGQFLGLEGKNSNLTHLYFPAQMAIMLSKSDLLENRQQQILLGGVDQLLSCRETTQNTLGLSPEVELGQGSNWLLLSKQRQGALASIEVTALDLDEAQLQLQLQNLPADATSLAFSPLVNSTLIEQILSDKRFNQYHFQKQVGYYQTMVLAVINSFIDKELGRLIYIDCYHGKYCLTEVTIVS